jgi:hypothetical protein
VQVNSIRQSESLIQGFTTIFDAHGMSLFTASSIQTVHLFWAEINFSGSILNEVKNDGNRQ